MGITDRLRRKGSRDQTLTVDQWAQMFSFGGNAYGLGGGMFGMGLNQTYGTNKQEEPPNHYEGIVQGVYKSNGIVFACMVARMLLFAEARFQYRKKIQNGRPGELFGTTALEMLEHPYPGGTTSDMLARAIQDADLCGNWFAARRPKGIRRMRPDWVTIIAGSENAASKVPGVWDIDAEVVGYVYHPGGRGSGQEPVPLLPYEVAHFAPIPDPFASFRGMSWITPIIREVMGDNAATQHKLQFFENAATPNMVVSLDKDITSEQFKEWIEIFESKHKGVMNAYKTLYLGGGAQTTVVGKDLQQIDFKVTQGAGETRIAAAAGIPPVLVGLSEGLASATYSNYGSARRRFADMTMRPLWRNMAGSLSNIVPVPSGAELWYDDRDIPALQEDKKDDAEIQKAESMSIKTLIEAGFDPASVIAAVTAQDLTRLEHTGLVSVQLQAPGTTTGDPAGQAGRALAELIKPHLSGDPE